MIKTQKKQIFSVFRIQIIVILLHLSRCLKFLIYEMGTITEFNQIK